MYLGPSISNSCRGGVSNIFLKGVSNSCRGGVSDIFLVGAVSDIFLIGVSNSYRGVSNSCRNLCMNHSHYKYRAISLIVDSHLLSFLAYAYILGVLSGKTLLHHILKLN